MHGGINCTLYKTWDKCGSHHHADMQLHYIAEVCNKGFSARALMPIQITK